MGFAKDAFFQIARAEELPGFVPSTAPVRGFTERKRLLASIADALSMLRSEITDLPGAIDSASGDYSQACNVALDRVDAIELHIKKL